MAPTTSSPAALPVGSAPHDQHHHSHAGGGGAGATSNSAHVTQALPPVLNATPSLLDCWALRDLARFRAVLKGGGQITRHEVMASGGGGGNSGGGGGSASYSNGASASAATFSRSPGHSWGAPASLGPHPSGHCPPSEVNRKDHLGRTVLHLIAASTEPSAVDYLTALLAHPSINVNAQDAESGWTPLHRALYAGNLQTALTLLRRSPPADVRVKDFEGLTPLDLYNSTIHGTNPRSSAGGSGSASAEAPLDSALADSVGALAVSSAPPAGPTGTPPSTELFMWGANRNFTLGLGDSDDRGLPDRVKLRRAEGEGGGVEAPPHAVPGARYDRVGVRDVKMTKFHTVVLTSEPRANVWVCGIGNYGRLGRSPQTQTSLQPLADFHETAVGIATGPDHTCIVTSTGGLYTFGLNRFHQLGYVPEAGLGRAVASGAIKGMGGAASATFGAASASAGGASAGSGGGSGGPSGGPAEELDVQITPRRLAGPLKKEVVLGVAAGKLHCAAFTAEALFTWGTNTGQLGYDRSSTPVQVSPRKVSALTTEQSVAEVAVTDVATCCLLRSGDVLCLHNDASFFVRFPTGGFSSNMQVFRPRQARPKMSIKRLTAGPERSFAAISDMGDLYTFHLDHPSEYAKSSSAASGGGGGGSTASSRTTNAVRPQLVWSVRKNKKVGAAEQVAVGAGGDLILATESGHVFVRSKRGGGGGGGEAAGGGFKELGSAGGPNASSTGVSTAVTHLVFTGATKVGKSGWRPIPLLQRVVRVATNESGGFAAIKAHFTPREIRVRGRRLEDDLSLLLAHLRARTNPLAGDDEDQLLIAPDVAQIKGRAYGDLEGAEDHELEHLDPARAADPERDSDSASDVDEEDGGGRGERYVRMAKLLAEAVRRWERDEAEAHESGVVAPRFSLQAKAPPFGSDTLLVAGGRYVPAHRAILAARLPILAPALEAGGSGNNRGKPLQGVVPAGVAVKRVDEACVVTLPGCSFATGLFLLHFLYTDDLPPVWSASLALRVGALYKEARIERTQLHDQLLALAKLLGLASLEQCLRSSIPRAPAPTLPSDMRALFERHVAAAAAIVGGDAESCAASPLHDVVLTLADRSVPAHSALLRRSPFFAALFQPHWTFARWRGGAITIDMSHLRWEVAEVVLRHLYYDGGVELFHGTESERDHDAWSDFVVEVMAASNELLLDKLKLVCSQLLRRRLQPTNVARLAATADHLYAVALKEVAMDYMAKTMETLLEQRLLEDLDHRLVRDLANFVRAKQDERTHRSRAADYLSTLMVKHVDWCDELDLPSASLNVVSYRLPKRPPRSPRSQPVDASYSRRHGGAPTAKTPLQSPEVKPVSNASGGAAGAGAGASDSAFMFSMDEDEETRQQPSPTLAASRGANARRSPAPFSLGPSRTSGQPTTAAAPWRSGSGGGVGGGGGGGGGVGHDEREAAERRARSVAAAAPPPVVDLRTIMAAEQQARRPSGGGSGANSASHSGTVTPVRQAAVAGAGAGAPVLGSSAHGAAAAELGIPLGVSAKLSQRDRKKALQLQSGASSGSSSGGGSGGGGAPISSPPGAVGAAAAAATQGGGAASPWRSTRAAGVASLAEGVVANGARSATASPTSILATAGAGSAPASRANAAATAASPNGVASPPPMGPTYTPTRASARPPPPQKRSPGGGLGGSAADNVWTSMTPAGMVATPTSIGSWSSPAAHVANSTAGASQSWLASSSPTTSVGGGTSPPAATAAAVAPLSLLSIQAEEQRRKEAQQAATWQDGRRPQRPSFAELVEEERRETERRAEEARRAQEFERWFEEEAARRRRAEGKEAAARGARDKGEKTADGGVAGRGGGAGGRGRGGKGGGGGGGQGRGGGRRGGKGSGGGGGSGAESNGQADASNAGAGAPKPHATTTSGGGGRGAKGGGGGAAVGRGGRSGGGRGRGGGGGGRGGAANGGGGGARPTGAAPHAPPREASDASANPTSAAAQKPAPAAVLGTDSTS